MKDDVILREMEIGDTGWVIGRHIDLYTQEEGFDRKYEPLIVRFLAAVMSGFNTKTDQAWVVAKGQARLGCVFCMHQSDEVAKLRLFFVVPQARGEGVGRGLLNACVDFARERGYKKLTLQTYGFHERAKVLYEKNGFKKVEEWVGTSFGQKNSQETWELDL